MTSFRQLNLSNTSVDILKLRQQQASLTTEINRLKQKETLSQADHRHIRRLTNEKHANQVLMEKYGKEV